VLLAAGGVSADEDAELARVGLPGCTSTNAVRTLAATSYSTTNAPPRWPSNTSLISGTGGSLTLPVLGRSTRRDAAATATPKRCGWPGSPPSAHLSSPPTTRRTAVPTPCAGYSSRPNRRRRSSWPRRLGDRRPPRCGTSSGYGFLTTSVIAVHDLALAGRLVPPLTTVRMPLAGLGALAVELLLGRPADSEIHEVVRDPIDPVIRESTAP
jgi:hypothetical protein